jgi:hypothetical protein
MFSAYAVEEIGWSGRVDSNHRPQRPERCALNQTALRPASDIIGGFRLFSKEYQGARNHASIEHQLAFSI